MKFKLTRLTLATAAIIVQATFLSAISVAQEAQEQADEQEAQQEEQEQEEQDQEEPTLDEARFKAIQGIAEQAQNGDFEDAIKAAESFLKEHNGDEQMSMVLLRLLTMYADQLASTDRKAANPHWYRAAKMIREFSDKGLVPEEAKPNVSFMIYNEACSHALDGNKEAAMKSLVEAFEWGFDDVEMASSDADLESLSDNEEFQSFLEDQRIAILKRITEETKEELAHFESFDFDFKLDNIEGNEIALSNYEGKVVIVDFWGTWCGPCIQEIPSFIKLKDELGEKGFDVVGLNYEHGDDAEENTEKVKTFINDHDINYTCALGDEATMEQVPQFQGFPTTLFVDKTGKVRLMLVGLHRYEKLKSVVTQLMEE